MKVELNSNGLITIQAETETEAYALKKWSKDNETLNTNVCIMAFVATPPNQGV